MNKKELAPINLYTYVSKCSPEDVDVILRKAGYKKRPRNLKERSIMLSHLVKEDKESALMDIAKIHPDRELILKDIEVNQISFDCNEGKEDEKVKSDRDLKTDIEMKNAAGTFIPNKNNFVDDEQKQGLSDKTVNMLIVSGSVIFISAIMGLTIASLRSK